ncbi:hypothetical protein [Actinomadura decatromicini]|uniref:Uncharacterized protein n=1 Tax=Actinomadura decatromicini TaxID=2604572 RepID=A0A5D3FWP3_9ACTN|nr:hypothetical protein [Actinomadura decatromicini]TYK52409.1 hypothetical protein FXF68_01055 [Actinomadura decatromicini]
MAALGLTCYTANLHRYLDAEWDADRLIASSIRLSVRADGDRLAFSHHAPPLDRLPDGSLLRYRGTHSVPPALPHLEAELKRHGRTLVVTDGARLPWSVTYGGRPAPHWLLIDGHQADSWHAVDEFTALLPDGSRQHAHRGWLSTAELSTAMAVPPSWTPEQHRRNTLAFGSPVPVPAAAALWLHRSPGTSGPARSTDAEGWLTGDDTVLPFLANRLSGDGALLSRHLEDLWAAAGHRCFACRHRLAAEPDDDTRQELEATLARWERLPQTLRIATESADRGRPRLSLIRASLTGLLHMPDDEQAPEGAR